PPLLRRLGVRPPGTARARPRQPREGGARPAGLRRRAGEDRARVRLPARGAALPGPRPRLSEPHRRAVKIGYSRRRARRSSRDDLPSLAAMFRAVAALG